jgi:hypothetical protein
MGQGDPQFQFQPQYDHNHIHPSSIDDTSIHFMKSFILHIGSSRDLEESERCSPQLYSIGLRYLI